MTQRKNNIYTKSYLRKRLIEAGIIVRDLVSEYNDNRCWTFMIDPNHQQILLTCIKKNKDDFYFQLLFEEKKIRITTLSADVLIKEIQEIIEK
jgi:hypothetical protein